LAGCDPSSWPLLGPEGFFELVKQGYRASGRNVHQVSNILIEFASETVATAESYSMPLQRSPRKDGTVSPVLIGGRYCDLFEKCNGEWSLHPSTVTAFRSRMELAGLCRQSARMSLRLLIGR
jgi:hypothetical protein